MPTFSSKPISKRKSSPFSRFVPHVRHRPVLFFGLPFVLTIVGASFGLSRLTQTRYDYNAQKVSTLSKEEELNMRANRKRIDIREEYFRLQGKSDELDEWEPKRIQRPEGVPEWGVPVKNVSEKQGSPREYRPSIRSSIERGEHKKQDKANDRAKAENTKVVLGADGKPCRACNTKLAFAAAMKQSKAPGGDRRPRPSQPCPPDATELGNSTWSFLHSVAAYYPPDPSLEQEEACRNLMRAVSILYPCAPCADALRKEYSREAKHGGWESKALTLQNAVKGGPALRRWLCGIHNEVNERLGKPTWKCEESVLMERWKEGSSDESCG